MAIVIKPSNFSDKTFGARSTTNPATDSTDKQPTTNSFASRASSKTATPFPFFAGVSRNLVTATSSRRPSFGSSKLTNCEALVFTVHIVVFFASQYSLSFGGCLRITAFSFSFRKPLSLSSRFHVTSGINQSGMRLIVPASRSLIIRLEP